MELIQNEATPFRLVSRTTDRGRGLRGAAPMPAGVGFAEADEQQAPSARKMRMVLPV
jgi:hypothetical protein